MNTPVRENSIDDVPDNPAKASAEDVVRLEELDLYDVAGLLSRWGLILEMVAEDNSIPGSFWGDEEAGLVANRLYARPDTPLHSVLHEAGHYVCMDGGRRAGLDTNAGGDYDEENAVCYLQLLSAAHIPGVGRERMHGDMDRWGYSFRLGSSRAWFEEDADDARQWLMSQGIIDSDAAITWALRS